ncbi:MAG TPA: LytTR family DNA-binding domain-containing protein [Pyrinomonadaceae bacterium]|nr:LytTR family DNA-binding domain-containing protein [Pyrinomonadaceae bacterium]
MKQFRKALIVDDERLARNKLRKMLAEFPNVEIVGEADGVDSAIEVIEKSAPDVVFLDVQMIGASGFDLLEKVENDFQTIFVTAYDEYAIRAFEVNALDYLLKPVKPERLKQAIERLSSQSKPEITAKVLEPDDFLFLNLGRKSKFVAVNSIKYILAADVYSEIYLATGERALLLKPLNDWERQLPQKNFVRIHRSAIVNLAFVERVENQFNYSYQVFLSGESKPVSMSRRFAARLKERF